MQMSLSAKMAGCANKRGTFVKEINVLQIMGSHGCDSYSNVVEIKCTEQTNNCEVARTCSVF
jgi:hypothetical protein